MPHQDLIRTKVVSVGAQRAKRAKGTLDHDRESAGFIGCPAGWDASADRIRRRMPH
jgi:hypothetical protein